MWKELDCICFGVGL